MPKTLKNKYDKKLTYEKLMEAHIKSRKGKGYRKEIIEFNLKQEEYIMWLLGELQTQKYKQGKITSKEAHKYLAGHMGYIKIANVKNLTEKLFYTE